MAKKNIFPVGNLDLENDPLAIKAGDYRGALDVTPISDGNGNTVSYEPVKGNDFSYQINGPVAQTKVVYVTCTLGPNTQQFDWYVKRPTYIAFPTINVTNDPVAANLWTNIQAAFAVAIPTSTVSLISTSTTDLVFSLSIAGATANEAYWDWSIVSLPTSTATSSFLTVAEALDRSVDQIKPTPICFFDLLGEQFYFASASYNNNDPEDIPITAINPTFPGGPVEITAPNNGVISGSSIILSGVTDGLGNALDGEWIVEKVVVGGIEDADKLILLGSTYNAPYTVLTNAKITAFVQSVGIVGVALDDNFTGTQINYNLIQSKKLNFRAKHQIHAYIETDSVKKSLYFTDNLNPIRVMYYYGAYMNNGFLSNVNPDAVYTYDSLELETRLFSGDSNSLIQYVTTNDSGGQLKTGNYRYTCRFITDFGGTSPWLPLTGPINIYSAVVGGGPNIQTGNPDGDTSPKSNELLITGIFNQFYKYIEVGFVLYQGIGQTSYTLGQQLITGSSMTITHAGYETTTAIDLGEIVTTNINANYITAKSIDALNNRLIISNLKSSQVSDFSAFFETWTHSLINEPIYNAVGVNNAGGDTGAGVAGNPIYNSYGSPEYFDPNNTCYKKGFVHNETYRFGARVKLKGGNFLSNVFWIDDIRIDNNPTNIANPTNPTRRIAGLPGYEIYDHVNNYPLVTTVQFSNINWNYSINGIRIIDLVERIYVYQVEMNEQYQEVLGTGIYNLYTNNRTAYADNPTYPDITGLDYYAPNNIGSSNQYAEFNAYSGCDQAQGFHTSYSIYYDVNRSSCYLSFYSPDVYFNKIQINTIGNQDQMLLCETVDGGIFNIDPANAVLSGSALTSRFFNIFGGPSGATLFSNIITEGANVPDGGSFTFSNGDTVYKEAYWNVTDILINRYKCNFIAPASPVLQCLPTGFFPHTKGYGYAQYYRGKGYYKKFGPKELSTYVPTGSYIDAPLVSSVQNVTVYGDAFVQGSYFKIRYPLSITVTTNNTLPQFTSSSWGFGVFFYSQNRVNSQMRYPSGGITNQNKIAPGFGASGWGRNLGDTAYVVDTLYTQSYNNRNQINQMPAYDPNIKDINVFPTRIAYSQNKPNGSQTDEYRTFLLADCRDLEQVNGEIIHHAVINGELLSWQKRAFQRQYFNSNGMITDINSSTVILGDGAALSRRGTTLSSIGCSNKWSIVKGASKGGNDVVAWVNTELGYIIRFGYDGTNPISVVHNINGFIDKNTLWVENKDTPADNEGIHGIWNDERKEYIWTVRGFRNNKGLFNPNRYYSEGDVVYGYTDPLSQAPVIYTATQNTKLVTNNGAPLNNTAYWQVDGNPLHRNQYTLCFNELKNGFVCNYSFLPRIYGKWKKGYVSPSPFGTFNDIIFYHNRGNYNEWYPIASFPYLRSNSYMLGVMNDMPDLKKGFEAIELNSLIKPDDIGHAMEFFTEQHYSYLDIADFDSDELHDILWSSWIKNDATVTVDNPNGLNNLDTSSLFGEYMLWKYIFKSGVYNKLFGVTLKYQPRTRLNNS